MRRYLIGLNVLGLLLIARSTAYGQDAQIVPDVAYGHKDGMALTFDVVKPSKANGAAVLFIQSGGWYSNWTEPKQLLPACQPLLAKGLTVFVVRHGSAPKYNIPEIVDDVRRSVRFIRLHAKDWNIDPERLGMVGMSAGGHLTLVIATTADDGDANAKDEVLRQSSRIAATVAVFPPTDLRDWVKDPPAIIKSIPALKPPLTFDPAKAPDVSPVIHATERTPPTLLIHGDKDELVPIEHSKQMIIALEKAKVPSRLLTIEGAGHGFDAKQNETVVPALVGWFEKYLAQK